MVSKKSTIFILLILFLKLSSQAPFAVVMKDAPVEKPCGMVNFENFSFIITSNHNYYDIFNFNLYKIDQTGNQIFKKNIQTSYGGTNNYYPLNHLIKCLPTPKKGLFSLHKVNSCFNPQFGSFIPGVAYNLFDSSGNNLCTQNIFFPSNTDRFRDIGIITDHFFYVCTSFSMSLISPLTGSISLSPFHTSTDSIINTHPFHLKRILVCSENKVKVIDTTGTLIKQTNNNAKYKKFRNRKDHYYAYSPTLKRLDKLDTNLSIVKSLTLSNTQHILDFNFDNDTLLVSMFNNSTNKTTIHLLNPELTSLNSIEINKAGQSVTSISKGVNYFLLSTEQNANDQQNQPYTTYAYSGCFETVNDLNTINYPNDLTITSIYNNSSQMVLYDDVYESYQMDFSNIISIYNNSTDTIKQVRIYESIDKILNWTMGSSTPNHCYGNVRPQIRQQSFTININPYSTANILYSDINIFTSIQNVNFCYFVALPNGKFEKTLSNNSYCQQTSLSLKEPGKANDYTLYPNPSMDIISLQFNSPMEEMYLYDLQGNFLMSTKERSLDISPLSRGIYFLKIKHNTEFTTKKVVKLDD